MSTAKSASRVWFITGSSQGLGRALLDVVLGAGDRAVATLRRPEQLESLKSQYPPSQLLVLQLDVTETFQIESAFEETQRHFGRIDVVVNNAGYALSSEIETTPLEEAKKQLDVLLWGPVQICQQAIKFFRDINPPGVGGHILNISSAGGYQGNANTGFYHAGKFALEGFTESLAREVLPEWNITATIIEPGGFRTEFGSAAVRLPTLDVYKQDHAPSQAMARIREPKAWIGDPNRAGQVLFKLGGRKDLPMRVQLGTDASRLVRWKAKRTMEDTMNPEWEEIADSTNVDGVDKETVLQRIEAAWRKV